MPGQKDTLHQILDVAQELVQERGFNAVSYADISRRLGIRNASIHDHFPGKADLGVALVRRSRERLERELEAITQVTDSGPGRLERYLTAYRTVVHEDGRICLCAVLAGDDNTLPEEMRREVRASFDLNEGWLTEVFAWGRSRGELTFTGTPGEAALEGAMLLARSYQDIRRFEAIGRRAVKEIRAA
ncbi:TetR/AcrR family transcriptional regulator [Deinococcus apachensis]|uniref:TetR/AcrR family transcriptional regulator n=1 Tax=Deinococcus apachensis TaxID=309886 RepID=UPI0003774CDB|nr:TetR/AcrR family transcriptional regulator [Deinococcus apachensis]